MFPEILFPEVLFPEVLPPDPQSRFRRVPRDAQLVVFGEEIDNEEDWGFVLSAFVV